MKMMEPATEEQLCDAVREASGPLRIVGGGTRALGVPVEGELLSTAGLSGISLYEPGALTIVAQAGTPLAELEAALARENQRLPFEPMDHRALQGTEGTPTIGGVVAANISGPRRIQAGACRDALIGVRFVDGSAVALKNGGRVMKNVTGYDLVKLMAGSFGTLGVISEVSFKLLPGIGASATLAVTSEDPTQAVAIMSRALASPFEVSAAAHMDGVTYLRLEGLAQSVAYRSEQLAAHLGIPSSPITDPDEGASLWKKIADVEGFGVPEQDIWRLSVTPSDAPALCAAMPAGSELRLDWGGGLIWAAVAKDTDVRRIAPEIAGHRMLVRASAATKNQLGVFHPEPQAVQRLSAGLREKFDPRGVLNPGLMG